MGLIQEEIKVKVNQMTIKHYEKLGYNIPKKENGKFDLGKQFTVKTKDLPIGSGEKVEIKCDNCDKEYFIEYKSYLKYLCKNNRYYCNKCRKKLFNSGKDNPNYGGIYSKHGKDNSNYNSKLTNEEREIGRNYIEYTYFVKKVLARDNYTCQCCGKESNGDMKVHHIDGYNWCKEKRTYISNGITLCENCHKNFHMKYGCGNNTREQYEEWIGRAIGELEKYEGELPTARKIYCIEEDKIYNSAEELAKNFNLKVISEIYKVCNHTHGRNVCKDKHLIWYDEYISMTNEEIKEYLIKYKNKTAAKKVYQYDKEYNLIKIWNSTNEPNKLGFKEFNCSRLSLHCRNGKLYKGYYWSYKKIDN